MLKSVVYADFERNTEKMEQYYVVLVSTHVTRQVKPTISSKAVALYNCVKFCRFVSPIRMT